MVSATGLNLLGLAGVLLALGSTCWRCSCCWSGSLVVATNVASGCGTLLGSVRGARCDPGRRLADHRGYVDPYAWPAIAFVAIVLLGSLLPPWDFDVREYHLQVPKEWLQQGRIAFLPHNVYGNMPLAAEMHGAAGHGPLAGRARLVLRGAGREGGDRGVFDDHGVGLAMRRASRLAGKRDGILAAVYLSLPWVVHVSVNGLNDGVLAGYVFLWPLRDVACPPRRVQLSACRDCSPARAAAVKYPGVAFAVVPVAVWAMIPERASLQFRENGSAGALPSQSATPARAALLRRRDTRRRSVVREERRAGGQSCLSAGLRRLRR